MEGENYPNLEGGSASWGDFDNDKDLDFILSGTSTAFYEDPEVSIFKNMSTNANTEPSPPSILSVELIENHFAFEWEQGSDHETTDVSLTYNLYVRSETDSLIASNSFSSGLRKIVELGNKQYSRVHQLSRFQEPGEYYWAVQSIDNGFLGSPFSDERTFHVNYPPVVAGATITEVLEETAFEVSISDIEIVDPDNTTDDFTITIMEGLHYAIAENSILTDTDYYGPMVVSVFVNDLLDESNVYEIELEVINVNDIPNIVDQLSELTTLEELGVQLELEDLLVENLDVNYPDDFTLEILEGKNYAIDGSSIVPAIDFSGELLVSVMVNDGEDNSAPYEMIIDVLPVNDVPEITDQLKVLEVVEEESLTLLLTFLKITDPDNTYPDDYTIEILEGDHYEFEGGIITPEKDYNGSLTVLIVVNDGQDNSEPFDLTIEVTPVNDVPQVVGQYHSIEIDEDMEIEVVLDYLDVFDPDNVYPTDFSLVILEGANYGFANHVVIPVQDFNGELSVNIIVNDGAYNSDPFGMNILFNQVNDAPMITSQVSSLHTSAGKSIEVELVNFEVSDPDNNYPDDFILIIQDGDNYSVEGNNIIPNLDFLGTLDFMIQVNDGIETSNEFKARVEVSPVTAVDIVENISIYPNPFKDRIYLRKLESMKSLVVLSIYNLAGKIIFLSDVNLHSNEPIEISLTHLDDGLYFLRLNDHSATEGQTYKILKSSSN